MAHLQRHRDTFGFPARPVISARCQNLIMALIQDKETRLCSRRYRFKDLVSASNPSRSGTATAGGPVRPVYQRHPALERPRDFAGRYVFPYDAEDIKAHKWFRGLPWERLHELEPPHVPQLGSMDDTRYFDEEDEISDWSESDTSESDQIDTPSHHHHHQPEDATDPPTLSPPGNTPPDSPETALPPTAAPLRAAPSRADEAREAMAGFRRSVQRWAMTAIATPYDTARLRALDAQIDSMSGLNPSERAALRHFIRVFGRKERKRPRDRLLRDKTTRNIVMEVRKKTAFLGYTWRRMRPPPAELLLDDNYDDSGNEYDVDDVDEIIYEIDETRLDDVTGADDQNDAIPRAEHHEGGPVVVPAPGMTYEGAHLWPGGHGVGLDGGEGAVNKRRGWVGDNAVTLRELHRGRMSLG